MGELKIIYAKVKSFCCRKIRMDFSLCFYLNPSTSATCGRNKNYGNTRQLLLLYVQEVLSNFFSKLAVPKLTRLLDAQYGQDCKTHSMDKTVGRTVWTLLLDAPYEHRCGTDSIYLSVPHTGKKTRRHRG